MQSFVLLSIRFSLRALAVVWPRAAGRLAYRLFSTPRMRRPVPPWAEEVMARAERVDLSVGDQRIVAYRWGAGARPEAPRVLLVHGWESRAARLAKWVEPLEAMGFEVLGFDGVAHGDSEGRRADPGAFVASMGAVVDRFGPVDACVAHSLGGLSTLIATAGAQMLEIERLPIQRLVVIAGAESGVDAMGMFCEALGLGERFLPLVLGAAEESAGHPVAAFDGHRIFAEDSIPTLWFHDPDDQDVPLASAEKVARVCPHVTLERTEGLGHHRIVRDPSVLRKGIRFLEPLLDRAAVA